MSKTLGLVLGVGLMVIAACGSKGTFNGLEGGKVLGSGMRSDFCFEFAVDASTSDADALKAKTEIEKTYTLTDSGQCSRDKAIAVCTIDEDLAGVSVSQFAVIYEGTDLERIQCGGTMIKK